MIRGHLCDPATGAMCDNVRRATSGAAPNGVTIERWKFTYFECSSAAKLLEVMGATRSF